jgi:hypothetical protein
VGWLGGKTLVKSIIVPQLGMLISSKPWRHLFLIEHISKFSFTLFCIKPMQLSNTLATHFE